VGSVWTSGLIALWPGGFNADCCVVYLLTALVGRWPALLVLRAYGGPWKIVRLVDRYTYTG